MPKNARARSAIESNSMHKLQTPDASKLMPQLIMTARGNFRGEIVVDNFPITVAVDREVVRPVRRVWVVHQKGFLTT